MPRRLISLSGLFQVFYGKPDGTFRTAEVLKGTDGEPLIIPVSDEEQDTERICTRPFAVDWDGDGHLDLVVGNFAGTSYWFKGLGKGRFQPKPQQIQAGAVPLRITGAHSDPFVIDWDGDGDLDLLSGSYEGGVQWAENVASKGKPPRLSPFRPLIKPGPRIEFGQLVREDDLTGPTSATRIWVADVNGDGKLDILVGDSVTLTSPAHGLSEAEVKKKLTHWHEAFKRASAALRSATDDAAQRTKAREEFTKLYEQRSEFIHEDHTGFVWLYLRK